MRYNMGNMADVACEAGHAYPSGAPDVTQFFFITVRIVKDVSLFDPSGAPDVTLYFCESSYCPVFSL